MIDSIFASEFDLMKGCVVRAHEPSGLSFDEVILAAYMLPDGVQKSEWDISIFKFPMKRIISQDSNYYLLCELNQNQFNELVDLYRFDEKIDDWQLLQGNCILSASMSFETFSNQQKCKDNLTFSSPGLEKITLSFAAHRDIQCKQLRNDFLSFDAEAEGVSYGVNFKHPNSKQNDRLFKLLSKYDELKLKQSIIVSQVDNKEICDNNKEENKKEIFTDEREYSFYALVRNKRDQQFKRGLLTRSLAIASSSNQILYYFEKALKYFLDIYIEFPIEGDVGAVQKLLEEALNSINGLQIPSRYLQMSKDNVIYEEDILGRNQTSKAKHICLKINNQFEYYITPNETIYQELANSSLLNFLKKFQDKTMRIWNALLLEQRVLFLGYDKTIRECVQAASSALLLVLPLNLHSRLLMYTHLQDLSFVHKKGYIAAVSNPLFENRDGWWDVCCNLQDGSVKEKEKLSFAEKILDAKVRQVDKEFYGELERGIRDGRVDEQGARECFFKYTKLTVEFMMNGGNIVEQKKEEQLVQQGFHRRTQQFVQTVMYKKILEEDEQQRIRFKQYFGETQYMKLLESLLILKNSRILNDLELITLYSTIIQNVKTEEQLTLILRHIFHSKNSLDSLAVGLFSKSEQVLLKNVQLLALFETFQIGKLLLKSLSFIMLYAYEKSRHKFIQN